MHTHSTCPIPRNSKVTTILWNCPFIRALKSHHAMLFGYGLAPDNGCENKDRTCPILCGMQCCCGQLKCRQQSAPANKMVFHTELSDSELMRWMHLYQTKQTSGLCNSVYIMTGMIATLVRKGWDDKGYGPRVFCIAEWLSLILWFMDNLWFDDLHAE